MGVSERESSILSLDHNSLSTTSSSSTFDSLSLKVQTSEVKLTKEKTVLKKKKSVKPTMADLIAARSNSRTEDKDKSEAKGAKDKDEIVNGEKKEDISSKK